MSVDGAEFWLADESPEHSNFSPESLDGSSVRMVLIVEDPNSVFARAIMAGATIVWPVADQPYGWRLGRLADPFGHHWEIGKPHSVLLPSVSDCLPAIPRTSLHVVRLLHRPFFPSW